MAAVEAQMLFKMTGGMAGSQRRPGSEAPKLPEVEEKHSASQIRVPPRAEELLHEERPRRQEPPREEQPSLEALREVGELKTLHGKAEVKRKAPKKNKKDAKLE